MIVPAIGSKWESTCTGAVVTVTGFDGDPATLPAWNPAHIMVSGGLNPDAPSRVLGPLPWFTRLFRPTMAEAG